MLFRLHLPMAPDRSLTTELNRAETQEWTGSHLLGAWCNGPGSAAGGLTFVTFLPAAICTPGFLSAVAQSTSMRVGWARVYLAGREGDACSRRVVGWSIDAAPTAALVTNALGMAIDARRPTGSTVIQSDQGTQYGSWAFTHRAQEAGLLPSMGAVGTCFDSLSIMAGSPAGSG